MAKVESRETVLDLVKSIVSFDDIEARNQASAMSWIRSGEEIFRIQRPAIPLKHLVAYFVVVDRIKMKFILVDHIKAQRWLPTGGHVEMDEDPADTVRREIQEELHMEAEFIFPKPVFITETVTVGLTPGHVDVSLWYVVAGNSEQDLDYDRNEFNSYRWFSFDEVLNLDLNTLDPHLHRFVKKLQTLSIARGSKPSIPDRI